MMMLLLVLQFSILGDALNLNPLRDLQEALNSAGFHHHYRDLVLGMGGCRSIILFLLMLLSNPRDTLHLSLHFSLFIIPNNKTL